MNLVKGPLQPSMLLQGVREGEAVEEMAIGLKLHVYLPAVLVYIGSQLNCLCLCACKFVAEVSILEVISYSEWL